MRRESEGACQGVHKSRERAGALRSPAAKAGPKLTIKIGRGVVLSGDKGGGTCTPRVSGGGSRHVRAHRQRVIEDLRVLGNVDTVVRPRVRVRLRVGILREVPPPAPQRASQSATSQPGTRAIGQSIRQSAAAGHATPYTRGWRRQDCPRHTLTETPLDSPVVAMHAHAPPSGGWGSGPARAPADRACPPAPPAPECARPCSRAARPPAGSEPLCSRSGRWPRRRSPGGSRSGSSRPCVPRDIGRAGEDSGIDHHTNWLRFPYDSTFLRSHYLHPHPPFLNSRALGGEAM
eukprot:COSAG01_NODE_821_length_13328_cov_2.385441_6_plen_290_part_00